MDTLNFDDLTPIALPVRVKGKDYLLREATGDAVAKWRNAQLRATRLGGDGKPASIDGLADAEPLLVSLCLFEVGQGGKELPVSVQTVRSWPGRITSALFARAKEISELEEKEDRGSLERRIAKLQEKLVALGGEGLEKNAPNDTPGGLSSLLSSAAP